LIIHAGISLSNYYSKKKTYRVIVHKEKGRIHFITLNDCFREGKNLVRNIYLNKSFPIISDNEYRLESYEKHFFVHGVFLIK
jgi:hypothetical protein